MAKASSDRNTIDLFGKSPGRPRTQPLTRKDQLKLNKRAQREKEKAQGLKRLELIVEQDIIDKLDELCELNGLKRAEWLTLQIAKSLAKSKTIRSSRKATKAIDTTISAK
ncbi:MULTISPECIES: LexA regulated protein [Marinomonas]|uniref:LexA regulated protein n=1 Tax=Marinomonas rhodophyticola TaxID=2992803 RepID=A0ABT3KBW2_9GAMM|nr:LexA regulated protein [Marinomonas sp. KJ51-3]MCW4628033.1 LexA regulated protein [Marinomonas sp. KJ51-3]